MVLVVLIVVEVALASGAVASPRPVAGRAAVVVVTSTWQLGPPWPGSGSHVLPGWASAGPAYSHAVRPMVRAPAKIRASAMWSAPRELLLGANLEPLTPATPLAWCLILARSEVRSSTGTNGH